VAERLGLSLIEHKCLDYIARPSRTEPVTAGELAEITGLTTGAITGVINRLTRAGYVRREKNPADRRQVWIVPVAARLSRIYPLFAGLQRGLAEVCGHYSESELAVIRKFLGQGAALLEREAHRLRAKKFK
jgi:DNA-binding MarR family transcriptional regulator